METNRMMSPAARRLAAVVLAALLCLSLFWPRGGSLTAVLCGAPLASVNGRPAAQVMAVQADVACREQVNTMVRQVEDAFGPVALLVNNAGVAGQALFQDITDELWHRYFSVNVDGAYHAIQAVLPAMLHHHEGCIINTLSLIHI